MIRNARIGDLPDLQRVAEATGMFLGDELGGFVEEMRSHLESTGEEEAPGATLIVATEGDDDASSVVGAACYTPEVMAQGVMNLLFIGVLPEARKNGFGRALLDQFEQAVRANDARLAIIETASDNMFAPAWALYRKAGFEQDARVRDYYDDGLDKLVFRKRP